MQRDRLQSWGRFPPVATRQKNLKPHHKTSLIRALAAEEDKLPRGAGRSYGDVCLNQDGILIQSTYFDHFIDFDPAQGLLRCEAGVTIREVLDIFLPRGWMLPVVPGTAHVTLGGAIANDIHGKNHHRQGSLGVHVEEIVLHRSTGETIACSRRNNSELFFATIGGLGLTGFILEVQIRLIPVRSRLVSTRCIPFSGIDEFLQLSRQPGEHFEYSVAWYDWFAGNESGRGVLFLGNHSLQQQDEAESRTQAVRSLRIPYGLPFNLIRRPIIRAFNTLYYKRQAERQVVAATDYNTFFFPLDRIENWNALYGKKGFLQWQAVVPREATRYLFHLMQKTMAESRIVPALTVIKNFGARHSGGLLSFPIEGTTFALDFPAAPKKLFPLLDSWDAAVADLGGRLYPAKDSRMQPEIFRKTYPLLDDFLALKDPGLSSSFWRRITAG